MSLPRWIDNRWVDLGARWLLGGVFIYASLDKIMHPAAFAKIVFNYQLLPVTLSNLFSVSLPWVELFAGLALVFGVLRSESALLLSALLVVFIGAISVNLVRGVDIDCGCFTTSGEGRSIGLLTLSEDLLLLAAGGIALRAALRSGKVEQAA
ncbi:MAG: MauE/DoxX family redox-associated membrane protein [Acidobacteriota bacterium]